MLHQTHGGGGGHPSTHAHYHNYHLFNVRQRALQVTVVQSVDNSPSIE